MTDRPQHLTSEELADYDVGLLDPARTEQVRLHLAVCPTCASALADVRNVSRVLAREPRPALPADVGVRLDAVLAELARAESRIRPPEGDRPGPTGGGTPPGTAAPSATPVRRRSGEPAAIGDDDGRARSLAAPRPTLGSLESNFRRHRRRPLRFAFAALGACAVAGAVGFGGYLLSAVSGHNEPSADSPIVVSGSELGSSSAVENTSGLSPHRFSAAWNCARKATDGRISGIESSVVNGEPGLLVYLRGSNGTTRVVFVTGCATGRPSAGPSATIR
ncbi:anti-sigma factor RsiW [Friedmanniella endophytica]|uniref:Anti-sigma factor RsiW n=1 Tax=Microlunatus kandeliicorticis TaxID=1759536 RepID=A0A7W3IR02_9ACTN|nr:hypothetical protein [Microlunatus kandeliicorticis]MBA8793613.1 anti-sigma factor RsiW [Microlunatus kandeliicorticis]